MTLEQVQEARDALEAEGVYPSYDAVVERVGSGSKRDVTRHMQTLAAVAQPSVALGADPTVLLPEPTSPLGKALAQRAEAVKEEVDLATRHTALKVERQKVDGEVERQKVDGEVARLEASKLAQGLQADREQVELARQQVAVQAERASKARL